MIDVGSMKTLLNRLARDLVGDGKRPNLYFITNREGLTVGMFSERRLAIEAAERNGLYVEDRMHGEVYRASGYREPPE